MISSNSASLEVTFLHGMPVHSWKDDNQHYVGPICSVVLHITALSDDVKQDYCWNAK